MAQYEVTRRDDKPAEPSTWRFAERVLNLGLVPGTGIGMVLPAISTNLLLGLIEAIAAPPFKGKADLPDVARNLQLDNILPIAETL